MRKFQITVNGQPYVVEVEEVAAGAPVAYAAPVAAPAPVAAAPAPVAAPAAAPAAAPKVATSAPAGSETVKSPMPGTILKVNVAAGDSIKKGAVLCILEAMKMENEIVAPRDAVVAAVLTSKGSSVNSGDALVALQ